jgi:hypothetical protein
VASDPSCASDDEHTSAAGASGEQGEDEAGGVVEIDEERAACAGDVMCINKHCLSHPKADATSLHMHNKIE